MNDTIAQMRKDYSSRKLDEEMVSEDPFLQFKTWFDEAVNAKLPEPNAFALSTADAKGRPSIRMVLLKGIEKGSFEFYTNYKSRKAKDLKQNNHAAICFFWSLLDRQVRVEGKVEKVKKAESDAYFASRPEGSQIGAWVSPQSSEISSRQWLDEEMEKYQQKFSGKEIPRPEHWGGYRLVPQRIEFWQGRENRLHDRILYSRKKNGSWKISRLAP